MKTKKFLGILVSMFLLFSAQGFCQSILVATLSRGDTLVSVHYGIEALKDAYNKATDGDLILLSSGGFRAVDISKKITIRGAGMEEDTLNNCLPTILIGDFDIISSTTGNEYTRQIEGIYHDGIIEIYGSVKTLFFKCRLNIIEEYSSASSDIFTDAQFINCKILSYSLNGSASFYNCYVKNIYKHSSNSVAQVLSFYNSVIADGDLINFEDCIFNNSIIISPTMFSAYNYVANCIGVYTNQQDQGGDMFYFIPGVYSNKCFHSIGEVFDTNTFDGGDFSDSDTYQLQDSIRTKYLSHDETEIGLYGGYYPYDPTTYAPKIKKFKVARTSNANGQLEVEINVVPGATIKND